MFVKLSYREGNGIYGSEVSYMSKDEVEEETKDLPDYHEDNGVIYCWNEGEERAMYIPVDKQTIATFSSQE